MAKEKVLKKVMMSQIKTFKIRNRRGYAAVCKDNLTEGASVPQALERMNKALRRMGFAIR